jgi:hypothetical protein
MSLAVGMAVAVALMYAVARRPIVATINGHYISYHVGLWHGGALVVTATAARLIPPGRSSPTRSRSPLTDR